MEHLVKFTSAEGRDGFHTAGSLEDALKFVERLRNNEEVGDVRLYRLQEVPIEFKAYYKVEIRGADAAVGSQPEEAAGESVESLPTPAPPSGDEDESLVGAPVGDGSGRRLFGRG